MLLSFCGQHLKQKEPPWCFYAIAQVLHVMKVDFFLSSCKLPFIHPAAPSCPCIWNTRAASQCVFPSMRCYSYLELLVNFTQTLHWSWPIFFQEVNCVFSVSNASAQWGYYVDVILLRWTGKTSKVWRVLLGSFIYVLHKYKYVVIRNPIFVGVYCEILLNGVDQ